MRNADPSATNRDNRPRFQCMTMPLKHLGHEDNTLLRWHVRKAYQAHMRSFLHIDKLSEVGIDRYQNSTFGGGPMK